MKKIVLFLSLALFALTACNKKEKEEYYNDLIKGTWVLAYIDAQEVPTNQTFVMRFEDGGRQMYAQMYDTGNGSTLWKESNDYYYTIDQNRLIIDGTDPDGNYWHMELSIGQLDGGLLTYHADVVTKNGEPQQSGHSYILGRQFIDYSASIASLWEETEPDQTLRWRYTSDGAFTQYVKNDTEWMDQATGTYKLYGTFLVNNTITTPTQTTAEAWYIAIGTDQGKVLMRWEKTETSDPRYYQMKQVQENE